VIDFRDVTEVDSAAVALALEWPAPGPRREDRACALPTCPCDAEPRQALRSLRAAPVGIELIFRAGDTGMPAAIELREVHKRFGGLQALSGIDLEIPQGEFFGLLGPNGGRQDHAR